MVDIILPIIDGERCTGCGTCMDLCPTQAVELRAGQAAIARPEDCTYCGDCEDICPEGAIGLPYEIVLAESGEQGNGGAGEQEAVGRGVEEHAPRTTQHVTRSTI